MVAGPELRTDALTGEQVVIAPARAARPGAWGQLDAPSATETARMCPFCEGRESETPPELYAIAPPRRKAGTVGWRARLVPNKFPAFGASHETVSDNLLPSRPAVGVQDVAIHAPAHYLSLSELTRDQLFDIASIWRWRGGTGRPRDCAYTHVVVNEGSAAGASLAHTHSQLFALPFVPPRVGLELDRQAAASDCLVCRIIARELSYEQRVVSQRDGLLSYAPHASRFPYETVVAPIDCEANAFSSERLGDALELAVDALRAVRKIVGWAPANLWLTTSPHDGTGAHWRLTMTPRLTTPAGLELGGGICVNPLDPDDAAAGLRVHAA